MINWSYCDCHCMNDGNYRSQTRLREGNVFTPVCDSVHWEGGLCIEGISVQVVSVWGSRSKGSLCLGVSVQGQSLSRRSRSKGSLCLGVSVQGVSVQGGFSVPGGLFKGDPWYDKGWIVRILMEGILVFFILMNRNSPKIFSIVIL